MLFTNKDFFLFFEDLGSFPFYCLSILVLSEVMNTGFLLSLYSQKSVDSYSPVGC